MIDKETFKKQLECLGNSLDWDINKFETLEEWREGTKMYTIPDLEEFEKKLDEEIKKLSDKIGDRRFVLYCGGKNRNK